MEGDRLSDRPGSPGNEKKRQEKEIIRTMKKVLSALLGLALLLTLAACGGTDGGTQTKEAPDLEKFYEDYMASLDEENTPAMMDANEDGSYVDTFFPGLNDVELKQSVLQMAMISAVAYEIDLVECANESDVETVKGIFQARIDNQVNGGAFYPGTTAAWEEAELLVNGNVVALIVAGDQQAAAVDAFNALFA